jgi:putative copper resistance protein D
VDPTALYLVALPAVLYLRAVRVLDRRGFHVPNGQRAMWFGGLALLSIALLSPLDDLAETDLLSAHMAQHLLLADLSAPLLVLGARWPVYAFLLPPRLMRPVARSRRFRQVLRTVTQPWVAAPIWIATLYAWHLAPLYEGALEHPVLHALQHQAFVIASLLVWIAVLDPTSRRVPGGLWKIAHIGGIRLAGMFLAMAFIWSTTPLYDGFYGNRSLQHGISPLTDQQIAGAMMLGLDFITVAAAFLFFFWRSASDHDRDERARLPATMPAATEAKLG